ncbi:hypothetical protein C0J45_8573 [Silurus meridionalis]|nr:hypothetical protein C0J45_8573 [Silurus meridionalis]
MVQDVCKFGIYFFKGLQMSMGLADYFVNRKIQESASAVAHEHTGAELLQLGDAARTAPLLQNAFYL